MLGSSFGFFAEERAIFQPFLVQHIAANGIIPQHPGGPLAEPNGAGRVHPETHGDDGVKVVMFNLAGNLASAFRSNYSEFPNSC